MSEEQRYNFMLERDGEELALAFAVQVCKGYRSAVLQGRKRGYSNPHHGSIPEYRRGFIESHLFYKRILAEQTKTDACLQR